MGRNLWGKIYRLNKSLSQLLFMVFSTAFGTASIWNILIDNSFSIEKIALVSSSYVLIAITLLFFIKNKLNPKYMQN